MDESFPCLSLIKCGDVEPHNQRDKAAEKGKQNLRQFECKDKYPIDHASAHMKHTLAIHFSVSIVPSGVWYTYQSIRPPTTR